MSESEMSSSRKTCQGAEVTGTWLYKGIGRGCNFGKAIRHETRSKDDNYIKFKEYESDYKDEHFVGKYDDPGPIPNSSFLIYVDANPQQASQKQAKSLLRFYLQYHKLARPRPGKRRSIKQLLSIDKGWLSLNVQEIFNQDNLIVQYLFKVEATLLLDRKVTEHKISFETSQTYKSSSGSVDESATVDDEVEDVDSDGSDDSSSESEEEELEQFISSDDEDPEAESDFPATTNETVLKEKLVHVSVVERTQPRKSTGGSPPPPRITQKNLLLKISVIPSYEPVLHKDHPNVITQAQGTPAPIYVALTKILEAPDNFSDIKLATKDGVSLAAHKFMLAARSPFFNRLIKAETKKKGFNGTLKLPDMNAQPMRVILKWMYTDELEGDLESCVQEVMEGAVQFQLSDLMEVLDRQIITFCNPENMIRLHRIVRPRRNELPNTFANISRMIKEYLNSLELE